jgi:hypothetical protein
MPLTRISDSTQIDHPDLREFAVMATWVAKREDAVGVHEEFVVDLVDEEQRSDLEPWEDDPLEVAWSVVYANFEAADQEVEARVTEGAGAGSGTLADRSSGCPRSLARATRALGRGCPGVGAKSRDEDRARARPAGSLGAAARGRHLAEYSLDIPRRGKCATTLFGCSRKVGSAAYFFWGA